MMAGPAIRDLVVENLNTPGNVMNLQSDAHSAYDDIEWGIEGRKRGQKV
jgi:hypothetical protein